MRHVCPTLPTVLRMKAGSPRHRPSPLTIFQESGKEPSEGIHSATHLHASQVMRETKLCRWDISAPSISYQIRSKSKHNAVPFCRTILLVAMLGLGCQIAPIHNKRKTRTQKPAQMAHVDKACSQKILHISHPNPRRFMFAEVLLRELLVARRLI